MQVSNVRMKEYFDKHPFMFSKKKACSEQKAWNVSVQNSQNVKTKCQLATQRLNYMYAHLITLGTDANHLYWHA